MASQFGTMKDAAQLALRAREAVRNGDMTPFIPALVFALSKDLLFDIVPIVGKPFSVAIALYIFIFMWGRGKWKVRLTIFIFSFLGIIPGIGLLPEATICVAYGYLQAKKHADQARRELVAMEQQTNAERIREYQMTRAALAMGETQQQAQFEREAANDATLQQTAANDGVYGTKDVAYPEKKMRLVV